MRKGSLWKKAISILLVSAMVLTAAPVSAADFEAEESPQLQGMMEEVPMEEDVNEETLGIDEGFRAEEVPEEEAVFQAEVPETARGFAGEKELLGNGEVIEMTVNGNTTQYTESQLGTAFFPALQEVSSAKIKLLQNISLPVQTHIEIKEGQNIELDFNGKILSKTDNSVNAPIENYGEMIVKNTSADGVGGISGENRCINNYGTMTINGGNYTTSNTLGGTAIQNKVDSAVMTINDCEVNAGVFAFYNAGTATINGGHFANQSCSACNPDGWSYTAKSVGTLYFNDGQVDGIQGALGLSGGKAEIRGGEFTTHECKTHGKNNTFYALYVAGEEAQVECTVYEGTFISEGKYTAVLVGNNNDGGLKLSAKATIIGGSFRAPENVPALKVASGTGNATVSGGKFSMSVDDYCAEGYRSVQTEDGMYQVKKAVASIEGTIYESLQEAINASGEDAQIQLLMSVEESVTIPEDKILTLDLAGYTLTNTAAQNTITNNGALEIQDTSEAQTGTVDNISHAKAAVWNEPGGQVTLDGGSYTRSQENGISSTNSGGNSFYTILNHGTMTINAGVSVSQGEDREGRYSSMVENGWQNGSQNTSGEESKMTITGGTFTGGLNAIKNDDYGNLTISGGTFHNSSQAAVLNWNVATISDGEFISEKNVILNGYGNDSMDQGKLTISGGSYACGSGYNIFEKMGDNIGTIEVFGGSYNKKFPEEYCKRGYMQGSDLTVGQYATVTFEMVGDDGVTAPDPVRVIKGKKAADPKVSQEGFLIDGWYQTKGGDDALSGKWNFTATAVENDITLYAKVTSAENDSIQRTIASAAKKFNDYCNTLQTGDLQGKTLADMTASALHNPEIQAALKVDAAKAELKAALDLIDSIPASSLETYLDDSSHSGDKILVENLRNMQDLVFAVQAEAAPVEDQVDPNKVETPEAPSVVPEESKDKVQDKILKEIPKALNSIVSEVIQNEIVNQKPAQGLKEAAKNAVKEPSVVFIKTELTDVELAAEVKKDAGQTDYTVSLLPAKITYEVAPYRQAATVNSNGEIQGKDPDAPVERITNDELQKSGQSVTFFLPIPSSVIQSYVKVYHNDDLMGHLPIKTEGEAKYVAVTTKKFSTFTLEFTNDSGYIPPAVSYYNVTFDSQGGSAVPVINSVRENTVITKPSDPTKENFVFGGWFKDAACTQAWDFSKDTVTKDITLYAKWTEEAPASVLDPVTVKVDFRTMNTVKISWSESSKAEGYTVWARAEDQTGYKRVAIISKDAARTYTWKKREPGTKHFFVVKAWIKDENGKYVFSEASKTVRGTTKPETAKIQKVTVNAAGDLKVTLVGPAKGANRYAMCWSRKADFSKYAIGIRTQYTSRTMVKGLKPGTCYIKVRSYRQMGVSRVYGDWSEIVKVTF